MNVGTKPERVLCAVWTSESRLAGFVRWTAFIMGARGCQLLTGDGVPFVRIPLYSRPTRMSAVRVLCCRALFTIPCPPFQGLSREP